MLTLTYSKDLFFAGAKASLFLTEYAIIAADEIVAVQACDATEVEQQHCS